MLKSFLKVSKTLIDIFDTTDQSDQNKFSCLDGFRGMLALIVIVTHSKFNGNCEIVNFIESKALIVAVNGFFILSAFLLTYRLLNELNKSAGNYRKQFLILLKYTVRRFFRIYVVFFVFASSVKFGPKIIGGIYSYSDFNQYSSWTSLISLGHSGLNHMWTIAPECKYYFLIPLICLVASKFGRFLYVFLIMCLCFTISNEYFNYFKLTAPDFDNYHRHILTTRFTVFFYGSIAAIALVVAENLPNLKETIKNKYSQKFICFLSVFLFILGFKHVNQDRVWHENTAGKIWSTFLFLMTIAEPNLLTNYFSQSNFLKSCGKYSFGMYLLHPMFIRITHLLKIVSSQMDLIIVVTFFTYLGAYLFFHLLENQLIKLANKICKRLEQVAFFQNNAYSLVPNT